MSEPDRFPLSSETILTQQQLAAVGCVAIESTYLEQVLERFIWALAGLDEKAGIHFTHKLSVGPRIDLLRELVLSKLDAQYRDEFGALIGRLKESNERRNTIVHGAWITTVSNVMVLWRDGPEKYDPALARRRRIGKPDLEFSAVEVIKVAEALSDLRYDLMEFFDQAMPDMWTAPLSQWAGRA